MVAAIPFNQETRARIIMKGAWADLAHECTRRRFERVSNVRTDIDRGLIRATIHGNKDFLEKQIAEWMSENIIAPFPSGTLLYFVWLE